MGFTFGVTYDGITAAEMNAAAQEIRPEINKRMRGIMRQARAIMIRRFNDEFQTRSGKDLSYMRRAPAGSKVTNDGVMGWLRKLAPILNIFEGGAHIPAMTIRPKVPGGVLRMPIKGGGFHFARGPVNVPAHTLRPRPIKNQSVEAVIPIVKMQLSQVIANAVQRKRGSPDDAAD